MVENKFKIEIVTGIIITIGLIVILIFVLPKIFVDTLFSENTGLYFYSALVQSNAALFSILAIFIIFRLQYISSSIMSIRSELMGVNPMVADRARAFFEHDSEGRKHFIESIITNIDHYIKQLYINADKHLDEREKIKEMYLRPMILLLLIIMFQVILLLLASGIHSIGAIHEASVFGFVIIVQIFALILILKNIKKMI